MNPTTEALLVLGLAPVITFAPWVHWSDPPWRARDTDQSLQYKSAPLPEIVDGVADVRRTREAFSKASITRPELT
jgi:hypothetical protein